MWRSMSIQGPKARGLYVQPEALYRFKEMVAAIVMDHVLVISTPYRTDILYQADNCQAETLCKAWFVFAGNPSSSSCMDCIHLSEGKEEVLQHYFTSLGYLMSNTYAFGCYRNQFNQLRSAEAENPILQEISRCDKHLQDKIGSIRLPLVMDLPSVGISSPFNCKAFAQESRVQASLN
ncbi:hypothetical protein QWY31_00655 [Cytophagales bacterium LB-30]|uniref:Uncharacterized protein n=1 Tax=Shiella aurantiaca TaxID=3058365 RepID=A0ABT8F1S9_9BACT|nr:hypothetical protein [Shiella aurantiaca]MDN4163986.1 hypothetical protein [Shiella aurantiaca]